MGVTYLKMGELQKAQKTFQQSINWAKKNNNPVYVGIAEGNYGNTLRLQGRYKESLPHLYIDVDMNRDTVPSNCAISWFNANSLLHLDSITKANEYLELAVKLKPDWVWTSFPSLLLQNKSTLL